MLIQGILGIFTSLLMYGLVVLTGNMTSALIRDDVLLSSFGGFAGICFLFDCGKSMRLLMVNCVW